MTNAGRSPTDADTAAFARLNDNGPVYTETDLNRFIVEPWNAASALLFLLIVVYWFIRLRGRYARYPFLSCALPLLAVGGVGGTLFHAFRSSRAFFLMDVFPIFVLCLATSVYLWVRLLPRWWYVLFVLPPFFIVQRLGFFYLQSHQAINFSYAMLAAAIVLPTLLYLIKTQFRHGGWVGLGVLLFGAALFFRYADAWRPPMLPMGTHWVWHACGAAACAAVAAFLYRVEGDRYRPQPRGLEDSPAGFTPSS